MKFLLCTNLCFAVLTSCLFSPSGFADCESLKRIHAHLIILDFESACNEAYQALLVDPENQEISESYIKALSKMKNEKKMIDFTFDYLTRFPDTKNKRDLLEHLSWGVIENAATSTAPQIRLYALIGGFFANDAKGVSIIQKSLNDNNSLLRSVALQISSELQDLKIQKEVLRLAQEELNFMTRLEAIKALGHMKQAPNKTCLEKIILSDSREYEEKLLAVQSLVNLLDTVKREDLKFLTESSRFGCRLLACEFVLAQDLFDDIDLIVPLLKDNRREVRKAALETIGSLRIETFQGERISKLVMPLLKDIDPEVSVTAAFVLTLNDKEEGCLAFKPFFNHPSKDVRLLATAALVKSGRYGLSLMKEIFDESLDPYIKMNISLGLISQRELTKEASNVLYDVLKEQKEPLAWIERGIFKYLANSHRQQEELIPNEREVVDQLVRLEIVNVLSIVKHPKAEKATRHFLKERTWGISAMASLLLLSEGDESAIDLVKNLLNDSHEKVRIQAALVLSLWDSGSEGLAVLQEAYPKADREMKEHILEGVGRIGSLSSIPFLLDCLKEPYQSLRVIAASSLLQTLYH